MLLLEKQIGNKDNPLSIEEIKEELNLQFERLSTSQNNNLGEESALFTSQFKGKCRNCGKLGHKAAQYKSKQIKDEKSDVVLYLEKDFTFHHPLPYPCVLR
jgi:hypothetical protein